MHFTANRLSRGSKPTTGLHHDDVNNTSFSAAAAFGVSKGNDSLVASVFNTASAASAGPQRASPTYLVRGSAETRKVNNTTTALPIDSCWVPPAVACRTMANLEAVVDSRLPLAVQSRRRKRLRQHQFDDALEDKKHKTKKKRRLVILFEDDSDGDEQDTTKAGVTSKRAAAHHTTGTDHPVQTTVVPPTTSTLDEATETSSRSVTPQLRSEDAERQQQQPPSISIQGTSPDATIVDSRPIDGGDTHKTGADHDNHNDLQLLQERLSRTYIGKPRKNRIDPQSQFADAVDEVQDEDDDSVGSGMGAAAPWSSGDPSTQVPLWEWFWEQQPPPQREEPKKPSEKTQQIAAEDDKSLASSCKDAAETQQEEPVSDGAAQLTAVTNTEKAQDDAVNQEKSAPLVDSSTDIANESPSSSETNPVSSQNDKSVSSDAAPFDPLQTEDEASTSLPTKDQQTNLVDLSNGDDDDDGEDDDIVVQIKESAKANQNREMDVRIAMEDGKEVVEIIDSSGAESDDEMGEDDASSSEDPSSDGDGAAEGDSSSLISQGRGILECVSPSILAFGTGSVRSTSRPREVSQSPRSRSGSNDVVVESTFEAPASESEDGANDSLSVTSSEMELESAESSRISPSTPSTARQNDGAPPQRMLRVSQSPLSVESGVHSSDGSDDELPAMIPGRVSESSIVDRRDSISSLAANLATELVGKTRARAPREVSLSPTAREDQIKPSYEETAVVTDSSDVADSSDSSVGNEVVEFTYKEDTPVGICERICKNDEMRTPVSESESQMKDGSSQEPYSLDKFLGLWQTVEEEFLLVDAELIEHSFAFRAANRSVSNDDSADQGAAQYGRILPNALDRLFRDIMGVEKENTFVDLGHGIGNACLQASYTIGCKSNGVELVDARFYASEAFRRCLAKVVETKKDIEHPQRSHTAGFVELKHGRLEDPAYHHWLASSDRVFVNNFNEVFGSKSKCKSEVTIDSRIAALFASMKPGSVLATMHPIGDLLGRAQDEVMELRNKHGMYSPYPENASFFKMEQCELGPANETVSWSHGGGNKNMIWVYKYTRLSQPGSEDGKGVFLCTNHQNCEHARAAKPIPATIKGEAGLLLKFCDCKFTAIGTRGRKNRRPNKKYSSDFDCS